MSFLRMPLAAAAAHLALLPCARAEDLWWERGAATWYYKDDWKGLALKKGRGYQRVFQLEEPARSGWIVLWSDRGYRLLVNGRQVGHHVDGALIHDHDLTPFVAGARQVTLRIEGGKVCAEGEIVTRDGTRQAFATGDEWRTTDGRSPETERMRVQPSTGAFHRAHNGRLLAYNDEERGKTAIAKTLARIQRLEEQALFVMCRFRPAEEIVSFDEGAPWRRAERTKAAAISMAREILRTRAIPHQKAGRFTEARSAAAEAGIRVGEAERNVATATGIYRGAGRIGHLEQCAKLLPDLARPVDVEGAFQELRDRHAAALRDGALGDWAAAEKSIARLRGRADVLRSRLLEAAPTGSSIGSLDEFPESPFGWLNARALMANEPRRRPVTTAPSRSPYLDLSGLWYFRVDPHGEGLDHRWHEAIDRGEGWKTMLAPAAWEREGVTEDNDESPGDCPYELSDRRVGDKPYNGFAWYRKTVCVPETWRGRKTVLSTGSISNWARIFVNGEPLGPGRLDPPREREIPPRLLRFGSENLIAIQVYNHDNFGGITKGPVALYLAGHNREERVTPGPLSYVTEQTHATRTGAVRHVLLESALSPATVVATDDSVLELWGWELRGHPAPLAVRFAAAEGVRSVPIGSLGKPIAGAELSENWLLLQAEDHDILVALERRPGEIAWDTNPLGLEGIALRYPNGPVRAAFVVLDPGSDASLCRFWARALRRYPVTASEVVTRDPDRKERLARRHLVGYRYLELDGFGGLSPLAVAPVPMLASFALKNGRPGVHLDGFRKTGYGSVHAPYLVVEGSHRLAYSARAVDRAKVMKGVGELFGKRQAAHNRRGGRSEDDMFQTMARWGFDHCRYAFAFHARWDLPLVEYMGGPVIEDNEAVWRRLDELVEKCNRAGMQMMLCWFFNEDTPQAAAGGAVRNSTRYWRLRPETRTNAFELWRRIAERYAGKPSWAVSYDFFNEPAYMNRDHWKEIVRELTAVIRSVDKTHMIVWESADGWAQPHWSLWMEPSRDANALYSFHHYGKHWGYAYDEYYPGYECSRERTQIDPWLEAILFGIRHDVPIHCGEFGVSMIRPDGDGLAWLDDYLAFFERFGIGWNWWNYSGSDIYRTGLAAGTHVSPNVAVLRKWLRRGGWGASRGRPRGASPRAEAPGNREK